MTMRPRLAAGLLVTAVAAAFAHPAAQAPAPAPAPVAIVGGTLIDGNGGAPIADAVVLIDARTQGEIDGKDLRNIKRGGFVPSSIPVYWEDLLDAQTKTFKPAEELKQIYEARGIVPSQEVIAYCQVGMRASVDLFALHLLGYDKLRNYYGAWEEWGNRDDLPLAKKP